MDSSEQIRQLTSESRKLLMLFSQLGPTTKETLIKITGYNRTTLNRILAPLIKCGAIIETGEDESSGGRRPSLFDINPSQYYLCGIDISRYAVRIEIFNLHITRVDHRQSFFMTPELTPEIACARIAELFQYLLDTMGITRENLVGIGLGIAGPYSQSSGFLMSPRGYYARGWNNIPIKSMLEEALHAKIFLEDGINAAILYHYCYENKQHYKNIILAGCGIEMRTGVIYQGKLIQSVNDGLDALGHMIINENGEYCECGNRGCVTRYSSIPSIIANFNVLNRIGNLQDNPHEALEHICRLADEGDPVASEVITTAAHHYSTGLLNFILIFNIQEVMMGGAPIYSGDLFFNTCKNDILNNPRTNVRQIIKASNGRWYLARGAAAMALYNFVNETV